MLSDFKLSEKQKNLLKEWQEKIKVKHGKYGLFTYKITPYGMGSEVKVYSHLTHKTLDISCVEDW